MQTQKSDQFKYGIRRIACRFTGLAAPVLVSTSILAFAFLVEAEAASVKPQPVLDTDFPDPFILPVGNGLVAYATNSQQDGKRLNVQFSRSGDGCVWSTPIDVMPSAPTWARTDDPDVWAPEVMKIGAQYVMYFSARHKSRLRPDGLTLCVGIAVANRPDGPFLPQAEPLTCGGAYGAIDASPFRDGDDLWLYVKTDSNCCGSPVNIIAQRLTSDGLHLSGPPAVLDGVTNDAPWEAEVVEGEQMVKHDGRYYMVYSANDYGSDKYAIGYTRCAGPVGPCRDAAENPILKSVQGLIGPGHQSVFKFRGKTWMAYHAWLQNNDQGRRYRAMYISPIQWDAANLSVRER